MLVWFGWLLVEPCCCQNVSGVVTCTCMCYVLYVFSVWVVCWHSIIVCDGCDTCVVNITLLCNDLLSWCVSLLVCVTLCLQFGIIVCCKSNKTTTIVKLLSVECYRWLSCGGVWYCVLCNCVRVLVVLLNMMLICVFVLIKSVLMCGVWCVGSQHDLCLSVFKLVVCILQHCSCIVNCVSCLTVLLVCCVRTQLCAIVTCSCLCWTCSQTYTNMVVCIHV